MRLLKIFGLVFGCIFWEVSTSAQTLSDSSTVLSLTFENALSLTRVNNHTIKQSEAEVEQRRSEMKATRGLYLPSISLNANYMYMSDDIHLDLTAVQDAITPLYEALGNYGSFSGVANPDPTTSGLMPILSDDISTQAVRAELQDGLTSINEAEWNVLVQKNQFGVLSAGFTQPIYAGGKIRIANQVAKIKLEEAGIKGKDIDSKLYSELVERYYGLVLSKHVVEVRENVSNTMQHHLFDAEKMMQEGIISNAEFLHAKVYASEADRELKKANRQLEIVNDALINTLSVEEGSNIIPITSLFYLTKIEPLQYFQDLALENNPLLQQIESNKQLAHKAYKAEVANYMPNMAAMGSYDIANQDLSTLVPDYFIGVGLKWDLFTGNARNNKVKAAKYQESQAEHFYIQSEADILTAITKYYQELNMYTEQLEELNTAMEFAEEYYKVREKAFIEGMSTTSEVSDAKLMVAKVKVERLQAIYFCDIALSKLLYFTGIPDKFLEYQFSSSAQFEN
jgi:outer membrane protein TolC